MKASAPLIYEVIEGIQNYSITISMTKQLLDLMNKTTN